MCLITFSLVSFACRSACGDSMRSTTAYCPACHDLNAAWSKLKRVGEEVGGSRFRDFETWLTWLQFEEQPVLAVRIAKFCTMVLSLHYLVLTKNKLALYFSNFAKAYHVMWQLHLSKALHMLHSIHYQVRGNAEPEVWTLVILPSFEEGLCLLTERYSTEVPLLSNSLIFRKSSTIVPFFREMSHSFSDNNFYTTSVR